MCDTPNIMIRSRKGLLFTLQNRYDGRYGTFGGKTIHNGELCYGMKTGEE
jgi:hypothetical protein